MARSQNTLTADQVLEIRQKLDAGVTQVVLAEEYNVSQVQISRIKNRQAWKHI